MPADFPSQLIFKGPQGRAQEDLGKVLRRPEYTKIAHRHSLPIFHGRAEIAGKFCSGDHLCTFPSQKQKSGSPATFDRERDRASSGLRSSGLKCNRAIFRGAVQSPPQLQRFAAILVHSLAQTAPLKILMSRGKNRLPATSRHSLTCN